MITDDRKKHIWAVAELLKDFAIKENMTNEEIQSLYTLGLLHDIGYEFADSDDYKRHNVIGGELLKSQGYKQWKEIYYHGVVNSPYQSYHLDLLNWADMHIDSVGNYVSFDGRLEELSIRYNIPITELDSYKMIQELLQKGYM